MKVVVAFGKTGLELELPEGLRYEVVHARTPGGLRDVRAALDAALDAPVGCAPLIEMARGKRSAAISICDITRPAPNRITLPPLLDRLRRAGLRREDIHLCIATGLHRKATDGELKQILGAEIAGQYPIVNHDAKDLAAHGYLGETARGTPVYVDRTFLEADLHLTLGFIEQHLMLGFSGGRKMIAPGLAAQETIKVIHSPRFMRESRAVEGSIEANPLHAELLEIARMARHDFIVDVTLTQDRQISGVFGGDPVAAHAAGVRFLRESSTAYVDEYMDAAITSAAGYPLDLTFYQTIKGITAVQHIVRPGGRILAVSECAEGIGSAEFAHLLDGYRGPETFLDAIRDTPVAPDQWQLEKLALAGLEHPLLFYTPGADAARLGSLGAGAFGSVAEAIKELLEGLPAAARVVIVPEGPYAIVRVAGH